MTTEYLPSSEAHTIDLVAMRAWHWRASFELGRDHEMRRWHRHQVRFIEMRLSAHKSPKMTPDVIEVAEILAEQARDKIQREMTTICAGDWEKNCELARESIIEKLKQIPPFDSLV